MRRVGKWLLCVVVALAAVLGLMWLFGPYEPADLRTEFDDSQWDQGVSTYLAWREAQVDGITEGAQKQVIWAGGPETPTEWAVVYIHGFSATAQEIRPVPDDVAHALGANLIFTRLRGHGRNGDAMLDGTVARWMVDTAEAIALGREVGKRVLVIATSTGGTLAAAAALDPVLMKDVAGIVMISPNFAINSPMAGMLMWPAARYWMPIFAGERRSFKPLNDQHAIFWTTQYPSVAVLPVAALVKAVHRADLGGVKTPALFMFSDNDQVVDATATHAAIAQWGGPVTLWQPQLTDADDPAQHVIAGDIVSPNQTAPVVTRILNWAKEL